jgi:IS30 family transposase
MTYDRGSEIAQHATLSNNLKIDIYFADPHALWQRDSNENTNGLIHQYLPRGVDLSPCSQKDLDKIARVIDKRKNQVLLCFFVQTLIAHQVLIYCSFCLILNSQPRNSV